MSLISIMMATAITSIVLAEFGELGGTFEFEIMGAPYRYVSFSHNMTRSPTVSQNLNSFTFQ